MLHEHFRAEMTPAISGCLSVAYAVFVKVSNVCRFCLGCCVYEKPLAFGESSSEDEDDCRGCRGHNHKNKKKHEQEPQHPGSNDMTHGSTNCPDNSQIGSSGT